MHQRGYPIAKMTALFRIILGLDPEAGWSAEFRPEGPEHNGASRSSSGSQVSEANATVRTIEAEEMRAEKSTSDRGHKRRRNRREVKLDTVRNGNKISTRGSTFFQPEDALLSGGHSSAVNSSFGAKSNTRPNVDDLPSTEETTYGKYAAAVMDPMIRTNILSVLGRQGVPLTI
jgi:hypothetical protein